MIGACVGLCNLLTEDRALDVAMLRVWLHLVDHIRDSGDFEGCQCKKNDLPLHAVNGCSMLSDPRRIVAKLPTLHVLMRST